MNENNVVLFVECCQYAQSVLLSKKVLHDMKNICTKCYFVFNSPESREMSIVISFDASSFPTLRVSSTFTGELFSVSISPWIGDDGSLLSLYKTSTTLTTVGTGNLKMYVSSNSSTNSSNKSTHYEYVNDYTEERYFQESTIQEPQVKFEVLSDIIERCNHMRTELSSFDMEITSSVTIQGIYSGDVINTIIKAIKHLAHDLEISLP